MATVKGRGLVASSTTVKGGTARRGTSLMEVLAAILIMSVGVLSVMTLFPISIIRSIQATNLTNATILAKRADALIDMYGLLSDEYLPQPAEGYAVHAVVDPLGWHDLVAASAGAVAQEYGNDGSGGIIRYSPGTPPTFVNDTGAGGPTRYVDTAPANTPPGSTAGVPLRRISYAANPINFPNLPRRPRVFPEPYMAPYPNGGQFFAPPAVPGARDTVLSAVGLPDSFLEAFAGEPDAAQTTPTGVGFPATDFDLSSVDTTTGTTVPGMRVTLFDVTGRRSQVRTFPGDGVAIQLNGANWEITWTDPLPADFVTISQARVEFPDLRYSWMLTVRKRGTTGGSVTEVDCVTFFNRPTGDATQEIVFGAFAPNLAGEPDPTNPLYQTRYPPERLPPSNLLTINYNATPFVEAPVRRGGFVFDPTNCLWYRVLDVVAEFTDRVVVQLERNAEADTPIGSVIVPEGVINVYPLKSRVDQSRLDQARRVGG